MNPSTRRAALAALDVARPTVARLDVARNAEDTAADLIEAWNAVETALRSLLGGSALTGQALIRELRQREMLSLDQAHGLIEFLAARDRAAGATYVPTSGDIAAARDGFRKLEDGLSAPETAGISRTPSSAAAASIPPASEPTVVTERDGGRAARSLAVLGLLVLALAGLGYVAYSRFGGPSRGLRQAIADYGSGRRERAKTEFASIARDQPELVEPHLYLGRMAREEGDLPTALHELQTAVRLAPENAVAQREMGAYLLATGQYELARRFYVRAVQLDPGDRSAMGFLGCTLARLGRPADANRFLTRAGSGSWSACAQQAPAAGVAPAALAPGSLSPTQRPPGG